MVEPFIVIGFTALCVWFIGVKFKCMKSNENVDDIYWVNTVDYSDSSTQINTEIPPKYSDINNNSDLPDYSEN